MLKWLEKLPFVECVYGRHDGRWTLYRTLVKLMPMTRWGQLRLHVFHRGDGDTCLHDHPSDFWTLPLTSYVENVRWELEPGSFCSARRIVRALRLHKRPAEYAHRLLGRWSGRLVLGDIIYYVPAADDGVFPVEGPEVQSGAVVTLAWWKPKRRLWGFWVGPRWVPWRAYIYGE